jgi:hypothetical protein
MLEKDVIADYRYFSVYRQNKPGVPERNLMFAVLVDAVQTYQKCGFSHSVQNRALFRETKRWFWSDDDDGLFSFVSICEVFGLDALLLRRRLLWMNSQQRHRSEAKVVQLRVVANRRKKLSA